MREQGPGGQAMMEWSPVELAVGSVAHGVAFLSLALSSRRGRVKLDVSCPHCSLHRLMLFLTAFPERNISLHFKIFSCGGSQSKETTPIH